VSDAGSEEEEAGSEETEEDAVDDDAEAEAEAKAKRSRNGKGKVREKGKKEEPVFTRKEVEALLQRERGCEASPTRYPYPAHPPSWRRRVRCSGARPFFTPFPRAR
jgi:hypothetical protein